MNITDHQHTEGFCEVCYEREQENEINIDRQLEYRERRM